MSICSAGDGRPTCSSSAIVVPTVSGHHLLKIDGYSRTKVLLPSPTYTSSCNFSVGGYNLHINYYPNGNIPYSRNNYISLRLVLDSYDCDIVWDNNTAQVQFSLLDLAGEPVSAYTHTITTEAIKWNDKSFQLQTWTCNDFIKREDLEQSEHLIDDCFTVRMLVLDLHPRCDITLMKMPHPTAPAVIDVAMPPSDLHRHLGALLSGEEGADVTFQVGGESFTAHRCVLAARSPVFKVELFGAMKESTAEGTVHVDGMEARVFKVLLHFIYTDALPKFTEQEETLMAQHLLVAADRYNMERLKLICEDKLCKRIDVKSAAITLALAEQHHCRRLKKACMDFIGFPTNLKAVEATNGFEHLARSCPGVLREMIAKLAVL